MQNNAKKRIKKNNVSKKVKPMSKLGQHIAEAKALGMEYGEYMAMKYMKFVENMPAVIGGML